MHFYIYPESCSAMIYSMHITVGQDSLGTPETRRSGLSTLKALSAFTSTPSMLRKDIMTCTTLREGGKA